MSVYFPNIDESTQDIEDILAMVKVEYNVEMNYTLAKD